MSNAETQRIVAGLAAAFPGRANLGADHVTMYVRALADLPTEELHRAAAAFIADGQFFPSVRDLRRAVVEARLGLPSAEEAWEQARRLAGTVADFKPCPRCAETGYQDGDLNQDELCVTCHGTGELEWARAGLRLMMAPPVRETFDFIGQRSIAESDRPEVVRAQFVKAYQRARDAGVRQASLESAGFAELAPALREIEASR